MRQIFFFMGCLIVLPCILGRMVAIFIDAINGPPPVDAWYGLALLAIACVLPKGKPK